MANICLKSEKNGNDRTYKSKYMEKNQKIRRQKCVSNRDGGQGKQKISKKSKILEIVKKI